MNFSRRMVVELTAHSQKLREGSRAAVGRVNFMVKLLRAHGGCLGRSRR
jgi:hypothetical protein